MPPNTASLLCWGFIGWLFFRYPERRAGVSTALWIPLGWIFIVSSRPVSIWIGIGSTNLTSEQLLDGSPLDSLVFLALIVAGAMVLVRRRLDWPVSFQRNRWLFIFFIYLGLSCLWSDYPFVALKRWIKDIGNVIMVLVVLSDQNPTQAAKFLLARSCYVLLSLSVLLIKYYPEVGRAYDPWVGTAFYTGVTTDKNMLGMTLFGCSLSLVWMLLQPDRRRTGLKGRMDYFVLLLMGVMAAWLLQQAHSSTALLCTVVGALVIWLTRFRRIRAHLGVYAASLGAILVVLNLVVNVPEALAGLLGRDMTLTGRTDIWSALLKEGTDPLFGVGYYSFWLGDRVAKLSASFFYSLNEAHDTYLETYLNSGLIGLALLFAVILSAGIRIKREAMKSDPFGAFRLACFLPMLFYGITEAWMNRLGILWFLFLLVVMDCPRLRGSKGQQIRPGIPQFNRLAPNQVRSISPNPRPR
jgi:exopolysaccharide production protein ExoQ